MGESDDRLAINFGAVGKPAGMQMRTYVSLLDQRQRVLTNIARHLVVRQRLRSLSQLRHRQLARVVAIGGVFA
jgi:hypothetical protein